MTVSPGAWTAMVLTGGQSRRLGQDKARATVGGRTLLDHVLGALPAEVPCIVVGPQVPVVRAVTFVTEEEPGGGPVSGIAAGVDAVSTPIVAVLAVDMPFAGGVVQRLVEVLDAADASTDAVIRLDAEGNRQPLAGAYRTDALRAALARLGTPWGRSMRELAALLTPLDVATDPRDDAHLLDIDTEADLHRARRSLRTAREAGLTPGADMDDWSTAAAAALGIDAVVDVDLVLDVAREAAHAVARPAAPVTTFLMGYAAASGLTAEEAAARLTALARDWSPNA